MMREQASQDSLKLDYLLRQGEAAARVGDRAEAETLLRRAVDEYPYSEDAWLALAGVVEDLGEKRTLLRRALDINPASEEARLGLERIAAKLGPSPDDASPGVEEVLGVCGSGRMTTLRCGRCGKPICPDCFVRHPVGLRCKECAQVRKSPVYNLAASDYLVAGLVGLGLSAVVGLLLRFVGGFGFFAIFIGLAVGGGIADLMSRVIRYKRGVGMQVLAGVCLVVGAMLGVLLTSPQLLGFLLRGDVRVVGVLLASLNPFFLLAAIVGAIGRLR